MAGKKADPGQLTMEHVTYERVMAFLQHLETRRHNQVSTRNVRLGAIRSFFRFVGAHYPEHLALAQRILSAPLKRAASREIMERRFWLNQYVAGPYPLPITLLVNEAWHAENATLGWHAVAAGGLEVIVMAGEHDDYLDGHLDETVAHVRALLDAIDAGRT